MKPFRFRLPASAPRTECACQPVAATSSARLAPSGRDSIATIWSSLVGVATGAGAAASATGLRLRPRRGLSAVGALWMSVIFVPLGIAADHSAATGTSPGEPGVRAATLCCARKSTSNTAVLNCASCDYHMMY